VAKVILECSLDNIRNIFLVVSYKVPSARLSFLAIVDSDSTLPSTVPQQANTFVIIYPIFSPVSGNKFLKSKTLFEEFRWSD